MDARYKMDVIKKNPLLRHGSPPELFVAADGQIVLSWVEKINDHHALRFATRNDDDSWSVVKICESVVEKTDKQPNW